MKIRIMTFHTPKNYGAVLQAYALQTYLKTQCDDVKIIDYNTPELQKKYPLIQKPKTLKGIIKEVIALQFLFAKKKKFNRFAEFVRENLDLTEKYTSTACLYKSPPKCDIMFTGSDQVFNPNRNLEERKAFYLDFVDKDTLTASYAASFGVSSIPEATWLETSNYLNKLSALSVRETSGVDIIKRVIGKDATEVVDPVFLLDCKNWNQVSDKNIKLPQKYILYYKLLDSVNGDKLVEQLSKKLNAEVVIITEILFNKVKSRYVFRDVGPSQFLYLYSNAAFVVTNAFHGTAFSLIFKKQFIFCDENPVTQERSVNLLSKIGLEHRMLPGDTTTFLSNPIDYDQVGKILKDKIDLSKSYIKSVIKNCEGENND